MKTAAQLLRRSLPSDAHDFDVERASLADVARFVETRSVASSEDPQVRNVTSPWITMRTLSTAWVGPVPESPSDRTIVRFVVVSGEDARDDKDLHVEGIDFSGYDSNPVWLYSHQWEMPPIGRCLKRQVFKRGNVFELWKDIEFTPADLYPFGHQIGQMHSRGWMRACSGGWLGTRIRVQRGRDGAPERIVYLSSDWMETSSCSVGIDKFALQEAVERGFVDTKGAEIIARHAPTLAARAYDLRSTPARSFKPEETRVLIEERNLDNPYEEEWKRAMRVRPKANALESRAAGDKMDDGKMKCPECGAEVRGSKCERCGAMMTTRAPSEDMSEDKAAEDMMECPSCGSKIKAGATECPECGADLTSERAMEGDKCPECGADVSKQTGSECPECGAKLPTDEEKKAAADKKAAIEERQAKAVAADDAAAVAEEDETMEGTAKDADAEEEDSEDEEGDVVTKRSIEFAALRGPMIQAMDAAYDQLFANTVTLAQVCDELRTLGATAFVEGRSIRRSPVNRKVIERQFRVAFERQLPTMVARALDVMTGSVGNLEGSVMRQVDRGDACVTRIGNALADIRDAVGGFIPQADEDIPMEDEAPSPMDITQRAGRKIAYKRRSKINSACVNVRCALRSLEEVLAEEEPIGPEEEDTVQDTLEDATDTLEKAEPDEKAKAGNITQAMRSRIDALLRSPVGVKISEEVTSEVELRAASISERFDKIFTERETLRPADSNKRKVSNSIRGVRLPN